MDVTLNYDASEKLKIFPPYPERQIVLRVCDDGNPYSNAFSFSSSVAVNLLTGGDKGLGAETIS